MDFQCVQKVDNAVQHVLALIGECFLHFVQNVVHRSLSVFAFFIEEVANQTADEDRNGNVKMAPPAMDSPAEPMV